MTITNTLPIKFPDLSQNFIEEYISLSQVCQSKTMGRPNGIMDSISITALEHTNPAK